MSEDNYYIATLKKIHGIYWEAYANSFCFSILKNGKEGKRIIELSFSKLLFCTFCSRHGGKRKIHYRTWRSIEPEGKHKETHHHGNVCVSCWNKRRALWKAIDETNEIQYLSNKLVREYRNEQRVRSNNGGTSGKPSCGNVNATQRAL